jgi:hypothetical protein
MQRLSAARRGTLIYYLRDAMQEGSADAVARLPVPRPFRFFPLKFLLFAWWPPLLFLNFDLARKFQIHRHETKNALYDGSISTGSTGTPAVLIHEKATRTLLELNRCICDIDITNLLLLHGRRRFCLTIYGRVATAAATAQR